MTKKFNVLASQNCFSYLIEMSSENLEDFDNFHFPATDFFHRTGMTRDDAGRF